MINRITLALLMFAASVFAQNEHIIRIIPKADHSAVGSLCLQDKTDAHGICISSPDTLSGDVVFRLQALGTADSPTFVSLTTSGPSGFIGSSSSPMLTLSQSGAGLALNIAGVSNLTSASSSNTLNVANTGAGFAISTAGPVFVGGNLSSSAVLSGVTLSVGAGGGTFSGLLTAANGVSVTGGSLQVTGSTTLNSALSVNSTSTFSSGATFNGGITGPSGVLVVSGTLSASVGLIAPAASIDTGGAGTFTVSSGGTLSVHSGSSTFLAGSVSISGAVSGSHGQPFGTSDSPTFGGLTLGTGGSITLSSTAGFSVPGWNYLTTGPGNWTAGVYYSGVTPGVSCSGPPTGSYTVTGGIVTAC